MYLTWYWNSRKDRERLSRVRWKSTCPLSPSRPVRAMYDHVTGPSGVWHRNDQESMFTRALTRSDIPGECSCRVEYAAIRGIPTRVPSPTLLRRRYTSRGTFDKALFAACKSPRRPSCKYDKLPTKWEKRQLARDSSYDFCSFDTEHL